MNKKYLFTSVIAGLLILTACSSGPATSNEDSTSVSVFEPVDYVHDSNVRLTYDYKGKDFYSDGVGKMDLKMCIDGDTAHFYPVIKTTSDEPVKARFYGIDTPESTGKIQPYGKGASNFTKEKLKNASENGTIVVSTPTGYSNEEIANGQSPYMKPKPDSTGSRYVSVVWINETKKDANYDELICLNLWIVQEGFSWVKNVGEIPDYAQTFYDAEAQAKTMKLNLHSGEDDPLMPTGDYVVADLLDMKLEMARLIKEPDSDYAYDNMKLRVRGTVAGFANQSLYLATYFSADECSEKGLERPNGEWAGINIYVGPAAIDTRFTKKNTVVEVCGIMGYSENFGVQLSGCNFPQTTYKNKDTDAVVVIKAADNTEEYCLETLTYTKEQLNTFVTDTNLECFNTAIRVGTYDEQDDEFMPQTLVCNEYYKASGSTCITLGFEGCNFDVYIAFSYKPTGDGVTIWSSEADYIGKRFQVSGVFAIHQSKSQSGRYYFNYQIVPSNSADLICLDIE